MNRITRTFRAVIRAVFFSLLLFRRMNPELIFPVSIPFFQEFMESYGLLEVQDKVVVDIGAEYGNSPLWWYLHKAKKIIAYEARNNLRLQMLLFLGNLSEVEVHGAWSGQYPRGDVFKIDCEGCEHLLTEDVFISYKQWAIAVHPDALGEYETRRLIGMITNHRGIEVFRTADGNEIVYVGPSCSLDGAATAKK